MLATIALLLQRQFYEIHQSRNEMRHFWSHSNIPVRRAKFSLSRAVRYGFTQRDSFRVAEELCLPGRTSY